MNRTTDFVRADTSNLPKVDTIMLMEFMKTSDKHNVAEIRGAKALMSSRQSYVESAVGYVEVKRTGSLCDVRAKIVPEHKINNKYYTVTVHLNEIKDVITETSCDGCAAAAGGCKHTLVFLFWLQKRSADPSPTSVECYWVKPNLKRAREEVSSIKDLIKSKVPQKGPKDASILEKFRNEAYKHDCKNSLIMSYDQNKQKEKLTNYCIFNMMVNFVEQESDHSFQNFKTFIDRTVYGKENKINQATTNQANSKLWHCLRQGRITGYKLYEIAHCKTPAGSLVEAILGGYKIQETKAMRRGKTLEKSVLNKIQEETKGKIEETGLILINGLFGASPDGICNNFVIEIKCPISEKNKKNYINNGQICNKYNAQVQLEMLAAGKKKCLFCVADPNFETNGRIEKVVTNFNANHLKKLMGAAEKFWETNLFPIILNSAITHYTGF